MAKKRAKKIHVVVPNEREWMTVFSTINAICESLSNFYVFKEKRYTREYVAKCDNGAFWTMQKRGWMDALFFAQWMGKFIDILERRQILSSTRRHLIVLDGYKSRVTLEVIVKEKEHGVDLITLSSYTSHEL